MTILSTAPFPFCPTFSFFSTLTTPLFFHAFVILFPAYAPRQTFLSADISGRWPRGVTLTCSKRKVAPFAPPPLTPLAFSTHPLHPSQSILFPRHNTVSSFQSPFELERTCVLEKNGPFVGRDGPSGPCALARHVSQRPSSEPNPDPSISSYLPSPSLLVSPTSTSSPFRSCPSKSRTRWKLIFCAERDRPSPFCLSILPNHPLPSLALVVSAAFLPPSSRLQIQPTMAENSSNYDYLFKVVLIGDSGVGKS